MRHLLRAAWVGLLLALGAAAAEPTIEKARAEVKALDFRAAAKTLGQLATAKALPREDVLDWYELKGIVSGSLKDTAGARAAFQGLLNLDPGHKLSGRYSPRVTTPFFEAKGWAEESGPLTVAPGEPRLEEGQVRSLGFEVRGDALKRVATFVVHVREGASAWRDVKLPPAGGAVDVAAPRVESWVELLDARGWVLFSSGSASAPAVVEAPPPAKVAATLKPPPLPGPEPSVAVTTAAGPRYRIAAWSLLGGAVATLGAGLLFGVLSANERQAFAQLPRDPEGFVVGLTRQEALARDATVRTHALLADVLFGVGGVLAATGTGLWIYGAVTPPVGGGGAGAGVVVGGALP